MGRQPPVWRLPAVAALAAAAAFAAATPGRAGDPVVIQLGDEQVTREELNDRFAVALRLLAERQGVSVAEQDPAAVERLRTQYLDKYAQQLVLLEEARRRGLDAREADVDTVLQQTFPTDDARAEFAARLAGAGVDDGMALLRRIVSEEQTLLQLREHMLQEIVIPPGDVITMHHDAKDSLRTPEQFCVRHIQIAERESAARLIAELRDGRDFAELAAEYSEDESSAEAGGDIGCFEKGRGSAHTAFEEAVFTSQPGEIRGPVETRFGYHVIEVYEHRPPRVPTLNEAYADIERELRLEKLPQRINALVTDSDLQTWPEKFAAES